ncbi:hypothetical protein [Defluviimonas sp. SAOS-178_SWC]|uniref:hypothetical protein n=1 Tax=Defluviimonas sp. SAOS-178_SWC TaxID=3121287 RepID=UPI0032221EFC
MFVRPALIAVALAGLSACADTANRCGGPETRDIRTIDRLIAETRANLDRGYTQAREDSGAAVNFCLGSHRSNVGLSFCTDSGTRTRPVALYTAAETRKLEALLARRDLLAARIAACARP